MKKKKPIKVYQRTAAEMRRKTTGVPVSRVVVVVAMKGVCASSYDLFNILSRQFLQLSFSPPLIPKYRLGRQLQDITRSTCFLVEHCCCVRRHPPY